ncbi:hypothetical protein GCM10008949_51700 [Deinococcus humi]|nr:hypothetical protein GCM10008949_51700 [Deinococcus humi]
MVQPKGMLNDQCGKAVAVGVGIGHGGSAYPEPVKATQPVSVVITVAMRRPIWWTSEEGSVGDGRGRSVDADGCGRGDVLEVPGARG